MIVANGHLETSSATVEVQFEIGDILFKERFIFMTNLTGLSIGLFFFTKNSTILVMRQGVLVFPSFSMQLKHADTEGSTNNEPSLKTTDIPFWTKKTNLDLHQISSVYRNSSNGHYKIRPLSRR